MNKHAAALFTSGMILLLAVIMLTGASVAWFIISTKPEISGMQVQLYTNQALLVSDSRNGEYVQTLDIGASFCRYVELRPVSTVDGVNWFLPAYEAAGPLKDPSEFILDDTLSHSNILNCARDGTPLEGAALMAAREQGYYVWTEFWLKTEEELCHVGLSVPGSSELDQWETEQGTYGTYALANYELDGQSLALFDTQAQAALRVGFLVGMNTSAQKFVIYEPNADQRSSPGKPESTSAETSERYVVGFDKSNNNYSEGYYIPTQPIGKNEAGVGQVTNINNANLIIQQKSAWDTQALQETLLNGSHPGSNEVDLMGRFVTNTAELMNGLDEDTNMALIGINTSIASEPVIVSLTKDNPQKIRMFIWLEGQDVDCWNDVAAGSFVINLEFAGETT
ncbi:MAG: hypothetical protein EOM54_10575 [Clostridia bacterium]|nr:hypothetical protein [Clostridia bacterium]